MADQDEDRETKISKEEKRSSSNTAALIVGALIVLLVAYFVLQYFGIFGGADSSVNSTPTPTY